MIVLQLDQAILDNLLVPSPVAMDHIYDVNLILRFTRSFLGTGFCHVHLICYMLNYEKLLAECCKHLAHNSNFPSSASIEALAFQQNKLKSLLEDTNQPKPSIDSPYSSLAIENKRKTEESCDQIVLYAERIDISDMNEKLRANLQGMQCWNWTKYARKCKTRWLRR